MKITQQLGSTQSASIEQSRDIITELQLAKITKNADTYLITLYKKANSTREEPHLPVLLPEEHAYIGNTIAASAHLIRYWLEQPAVKMPPSSKELAFTVEEFKKIGIPVDSKTDDIAGSKEKFIEMLGRIAGRRTGFTNSRYPEINKIAIICARELINLIQLLSACNEHSLPRDYTVDIGLNEIANHPKSSDFTQIAVDINVLNDILKGLTPDSSGHIRLDETRRLRLESLFKKCGIAVAPPTKEEVADGIKFATKLVDESGADEYLQNLPFRKKLSEKTQRHLDITLDRPIYINPESIAGANSFNSWTGRGPDLRNDDMGQQRPEFEIIIDYATRGTALPTTAITILVENGGFLTLVSENSRIAAAAHLRLEPLAVDHFLVYR